MRKISLVRMLAGFLVLGSATVLCQACDSTPGSVGGVSGNGGRASIDLGLGGRNLGLGGRSPGLGGQYLGVGGQGGSRARGNGGMVADAASADGPTSRKDARVEGSALDALGISSLRTDGPQAGPRDAPQAADRAAGLDSAGKEAPVRLGLDASPSLDLGAPDAPPSPIDAPNRERLDSAAATECHYKGATYAVGESFPSDCNTCFCLASGEVACTVNACPADGGATQGDPLGFALDERARLAWESSPCDRRS